MFVHDRHGAECSPQAQNCSGCMSMLNLALQEEERERRMDFVPEESAVNTELIEVSSPPLNGLMASTVVLHTSRDNAAHATDLRVQLFMETAAGAWL